MGRPRAAALSRCAAPQARTSSDARGLSDQPVVSQGPLGHFRRSASRLPPESARSSRTGERAPGWREGSEARRWRCWYAIRQPQRRWTFPLSTTAALSICRNQRQNLTRPPRDFGDLIGAWAAKSSARALSLVKWVSATG